MGEKEERKKERKMKKKRGKIKIIFKKAMILLPKNAKCVPGVPKTRPLTPLSSAWKSSGARILPSSDRAQHLQPPGAS